METKNDKILPRLVVYTYDVQHITGMSEQAARRLLRKIRKQFNKPPESLVSLQEFCAGTSLKEEHVLPYLR